MGLRELLAKASPARSGDELAGIAAASAEERVRAQMKLADVPLRAFLREPIIPYEKDEVTRLICDSHDPAAFAPVAHLTVGEFRDWLLSDEASTERLCALAPGLIPEMVAAVSQIMRLQDLVSVGIKCRVVTRFRSTIGLPGRISTRLQPNHPTDDLKGIAASIFDGLCYGSGDAVIELIGYRQREHGCRAARHARPDPRALPDSHADLRAVPCDYAIAGAGTRRADRSGIPVDRRNRGRQFLRREYCPARRSLAGRALIAPRIKCHVF